MVQILPFAEQADTFDKIADLSTVNGEPFFSYQVFLDCVYKQNKTGLNPGLRYEPDVQNVVIPWAVCPARNTGGENETKGNSTYRGNGGTKTYFSYPANRNTTRPEDGPMKHASATDGRGYSLGQISDGLAKTYLVWERNDAAVFTYGVNQAPFFCGRGVMVGVYDWISQAGVASQTATLPVLDNLLTVTPPGTWHGPNPNSDHPGKLFGALMADGSVRFDSLEMTNRIFRARCTRAGGESDSP